MNRSIAIVILNYNTYEDTVKCVEPIDKHDSKNCYQIIIVDNNSPDKSGELLENKYANDKYIEVIKAKKNNGFSAGNNLGIVSALEKGCDYIFLLNSDIILINNAINIMTHFLIKNDDVVIVGPSIYNSNGSYVQTAKKGITLKAYIIEKLGIEKIYKTNRRFFSFDNNQDFTFSGMVSGCCFGIKSDFIRESNCLDENLFMYYEEDILAHVVNRFQVKTAIVANSKVIHNEGTSTNKSSNDRLMFTRLYRWTSVLYVLKNYACVNQIICKILGLSNILTWSFLSLRKKEYRKNLSKFISETKRVLRANSNNNRSQRCCMK